MALLVLGAVGRTAAAQGFEVGASISRGCTGDSSGCCSDRTGAMWALHGGIWVSPLWLMSLRVATLPLPDFSYTTHRDERFNLAADPAARRLARIEITARDQSRRLIGAKPSINFRFGAY